MNEQDRASRNPGERQDSLAAPAQEAVNRWAEKLRDATVKAPLQALFVAFVLGIWVARRR